MKYDTGVTVDEWWPFFGKWTANSQYGYPLAWCETEAEAKEYAIRYYADNPQCDAVFVNEN